MKAVGYIRVSTNEQAEYGVSLEAQKTRIAAYCAAAGLELVTILCEEGISGSIALQKRPAGAQLRELLGKRKVQHIVALKLDRLFRDAADALNQTKAWEEAKVSLHLIDMGGQALNTGSAMGRMMLTMMAAFAEMERNVIAERTAFALQHKKAQNERVGTIAFGYQLAADGQHLEPNAAEQDVLARIRELREAGYSLRDIASELNRQGIPTRRGSEWRFQYVDGILKAAA